ncbi:hypothetical protein FB451DRAFT_1188945 [Mycena latifolia]|nr:hypothetical protein FB451DRAFT_1188945 [Mycena latifolia]
MAGDMLRIPSDACHEQTGRVDGRQCGLLTHLIKPRGRAHSSLHGSSAELILVDTGTRSGSMSAPSAPQRQPFPIAAAVAGVTFVVIFGAIIIVFAIAHKHRQKPVGSAEAPPAVEPSLPKLEIPDADFRYSRADGSTISISTPVGP